MSRKTAFWKALVIAAAAPLAGCEPTTGPIVGVAPVAPVASGPFVYGGQNFCWYPSGWQGAGFYQCGFAFSPGVGWGGGWGWNGWGGGYAAGWDGYTVWRGGAVGWRRHGWNGGWRGTAWRGAGWRRGGPRVRR